MSTLETFPVARYRFEFQVTRPIRLPDYAGSMLRGAFGHALKQLSCMTRQKECTGCPLIHTCPYPAIFSPVPPAEHALQKFSQIPVPYVLEPPAWGAKSLQEGETLSFHLVLIGRALRELPLIILAWRRALARGVGTADGTADLKRVVQCLQTETGDESEIHRPETGTIAPHLQSLNLHRTQDERISSVTLQFHTPLRLQQNGHALSPEKLEARVLLKALIRRANLLAEFHTDTPLHTDFAQMLEACSCVRDQKNLVWLDWTRYSSRQHQKMSLGGVVGTWVIEGNLDYFTPFLRLGEWLHVGKEATFGLGGYTIGVPIQRDIYAEKRNFVERTKQAVERKEEIT